MAVQSPTREIIDALAAVGGAIRPVPVKVVGSGEASGHPANGPRPGQQHLMERSGRGDPLGYFDDGSRWWGAVSRHGRPRPAEYEQCRGRGTRGRCRRTTRGILPAFAGSKAWARDHGGRREGSRLRQRSRIPPRQDRRRARHIRSGRRRQDLIAGGGSGLHNFSMSSLGSLGTI